MFVRKDLPPAQQAVQCCHASIEMAKAFLTDQDPQPYLVVCEVADEASLAKVIDKLAGQGVKFRLYQEPDRNWEMTAIATEPIRGEKRSLFANYRLLKL